MLKGGINMDYMRMVKEAVEAKADIIMLDNMDLDMAKEAIKMIQNNATIEFSK